MYRSVMGYVQLNLFNNTAEGIKVEGSPKIAKHSVSPAKMLTDSQHNFYLKTTVRLCQLRYAVTASSTVRVFSPLP